MGVFGDVLRNLFGGSRSTQASQSSSAPVDMNPAEFSALRGPFAEALMSQLSSGGPQYGGALFSPETANEAGTRGTLMDTTGQGTARSQYLQDSIKGKYTGEGGNPFLQDYITAAQRPTFQGLEETLSRALPGRFTQAGQFVQPQSSSAFDRAAAIATRGAAQTAGDIATGISFGAYEGDRNRQQQAVQLDQAEVDTTIKNLQAQALPRLIQELGIERGLQLHQQNVASVLETLRLLGAVTAPNLGSTAQSSSSGESTAARGMLVPSGGGSGGGGGGASPFAALMGA